MNQQILRPPASVSEEGTAGPQQCGVAERSSAYPQHKRRVRPGWKATIVRADSFKRLRAIQKSTSDPAIDLSYLMEASLQLALELGGEAIVNRALDAMRPVRTTS